MKLQLWLWIEPRSTHIFIRALDLVAFKFIGTANIQLAMLENEIKKTNKYQLG